MGVYDAFQVFNVTCPASVPANNPTEIATFAGGDDTVTGIGLVIPDGHAGLTGIAFGYGHTPIYPENAAGFISGNAEVLFLDIEDTPHGVSWSVFVSNNDLQAHSWQVRFYLLQSSKLTSVQVASPLSAAAIEQAA